MGNDIRDSTGTNEEHSSLKLSVYSTFISKLDKTRLLICTYYEIPKGLIVYLPRIVACSITNDKPG